jgi:hypothetical protein
MVANHDALYILNSTDSKSKIGCLGIAGCVPNSELDVNPIMSQVRVNENSIYPDGIRCSQLDPPGNSIPIPGSLFRNRGRVADIDSELVIYTKDQSMRARSHASFTGLAKLVYVRRAETVLKPQGVPVQPGSRFPVATLQEQRDVLALPGFWDSDFPLVPCGANEPVCAGKVAQFAPNAFVAEVLFVGRAGQIDAMGKMARVFEPAFRNASVTEVQAYVPFACQ